MTTAVAAHPGRSLTRWQPGGTGGWRGGIPGAQDWLRRCGWAGWATKAVLVLLVYASAADGLVTSAIAQLGALGVGPEQTAQSKSSLNLGSLVGSAMRASAKEPDLDARAKRLRRGGWRNRVQQAPDLTTAPT